MKQSADNGAAPIDLSPIANKMETGAYALFRMWTAQLPGRPEIVIRDEGVLVQDVREAFEKALRRLQNKPERKTEAPGWPIGFVAGMVSGQLVVQWHHDYIVRSSEAYQRFAVLKAVEAFLKFDEIARVRVDRLYEHFLTEDSNLEDIPLHATKHDISLDTANPVQVVPTEESGKALVLLNNMLIDQIVGMSKHGDNRINLDVEAVFTWEAIEDLVAVNVGD